MNLNTFIFLHLLKGPATLGEIIFVCRAAGYNTSGDMEIMSGKRTLWGGVSEEFAETIQLLLAGGRVAATEIENIDFLESSPLVLCNCPDFMPVRLYVRTHKNRAKP